MIEENKKKLDIAHTLIEYDKDIDLKCYHDNKSGHLFVIVDGLAVYYDDLFGPICLGFNAFITQDTNSIYIESEDDETILEIYKKDIEFAKENKKKTVCVSDYINKIHKSF